MLFPRVTIIEYIKNDDFIHLDRTWYNIKIKPLTKFLLTLS